MKDKVIYECELKEFYMCNYYGGCRFDPKVDFCDSPAGVYYSETIFEHRDDPENQVFICEHNKNCPLNFLKFNDKIKISIEVKTNE